MFYLVIPCENSTFATVNRVKKDKSKGNEVFNASFND